MPRNAAQHEPGDAQVEPDELGVIPPRIVGTHDARKVGARAMQDREQPAPHRQTP